MTMANIILCFLYLVAASQALPYDLTPRIVNGQDAKEGEFPYQVSLQFKVFNFHFCGGSILNENYVLTAAHCLVDFEPLIINVIAGVNNNSLQNFTHNVDKIIIHSKYNPDNSFVNDIALLKVDRPFEKVPTIKNVLLPSKDDSISVGDKVVVSGWGKLQENGEGSQILQRLDVEIADQTFCNKTYIDLGVPVLKTHICAYDPKDNKGACQGDSGGPLSLNGKIIGIASWQAGCARPEFPTVFTRVSSYLDWIKEHAV
ncbi:trypsin-1-like [Prorops nasuta]|uniref:trypsin-1-like n=1 Tax=Prorops nasuta TaxID=863751 RepID=UPI0034CF9D6C